MIKVKQIKTNTVTTVYTELYESYRVWDNGVIEYWDERNQTWRYCYNLDPLIKQQLASYAR